MRQINRILLLFATFWVAIQVFGVTSFHIHNFNLLTEPGTLKFSFDYDVKIFNKC